MGTLWFGLATLRCVSTRAVRAGTVTHRVGLEGGEGSSAPKPSVQEKVQAGLFPIAF